MRANVNEAVTHPFVLSSDDVKRLHELLGGNVEMQANCNDGVNREFESIEELLQYDNETSRKIIDLEFRMRHYKKEDSFSSHIKFCSEKSNTIQPNGEIRIFISGPEDKVMKLYDKIKVSMKTYRPWYSFVARFSMTHANFLSFSTIFLLVVFAVVKFYSEETSIKMLAKQINLDIDSVNFLTFFLVFFIVLIFPYSWNLAKMILRVRHWIFSSSTITIGHQAKIEENIDKWRRNIVALIATGFLTALASLFYSVFL